MGDGLLAGRAVAVTVDGEPFGNGLVAGLRDLGAEVAVAGPAFELDSADACRHALYQAAEAARAAGAVGPLSGVVHARIDGEALRPVELESTGLDDWDRRCEAVLRTTLWVLQAAYRSLHDQGGAIVVVTPTVGLTGSAGLVPYAAAVEGQRAMAKSAARGWGAAGITVNCVAPALDVVRADITDTGRDVGPGGGLAPPALPRRPDARLDVAPVVAGLLGRLMASVTGTTVVVDGGVVMAP